MFIGCSVAVTSNGASADVTTIEDDEPMCRLGTIPMSWHAAQNGSQCSECKLGKPSFDGFSENETACTPISASRSSSARVRSMSQNGTRPKGMNRPGCAPHHD